MSTDRAEGPDPLYCAARPCPTCPEAVRTPAGIWAAHEYEKLAAYDEDAATGRAPFGVFHCHQENATGRPSVCVGWLGIHGTDAIAVRLALSRGQLIPADVEKAQATDVELYPTGTAARDAGLAGITNPSPEAHAAMARLARKGAGLPQTEHEHAQEPACTTSCAATDAGADPTEPDAT